MISPLKLTVSGSWDEWGCETGDVHGVCYSVTKCFDTATVERPLEAIRVEFSFADDAPITHYKRTAAGEIRIDLNMHGRLWAQLAYQFAHEFCHCLANATAPPYWFKESLCELASLFALRRMAHSWREDPPYLNWRDYAPHLEAYAQGRLSHPQHQIRQGLSFPDWMSEKLPLLEQGAYQRDDNAIVAIRLLPLFENDPGVWSTIRYLNLWGSDKIDMRFSDYFNVWRSVTPSRLHNAVNQIERRLWSE